MAGTRSACCCGEGQTRCTPALETAFRFQGRLQHDVHEAIVREIAVVKKIDGGGATPPIKKELAHVVRCALPLSSFSSPHSPSRNRISGSPERMQKKRCSPRLRQSLCLTSTATVWLVNATAGKVQQSLHIIAIPPSVRDYLPAQREIIALCCRDVGSGFKVHIPRQGAPGLLSFIQLATFVRFTHTVYG